MRRYSDRQEAGAVLATHLAHHAGRNPLVLGIPRGGVVVASVVASALGGSLDVVVARKIGAPWSPELALGAVAPDGVPLIDREMASRLGVGEDDLGPETERQLEELRRREELYRGGRSLEIRGRVVIVVDDGVATGATLRAVIGFVARQDAAFLSCAVPVGPPSTVGLIATEVDEVVCPLQPLRFRAVGDWFDNFSQTTDAEVLALLEAGQHS